MRLITAALLMLGTLGARASLASPIDFSKPEITGVDRNGPPLELGDRVDWTVTLRNTGYMPAAVYLWSSLDTTRHEFVEASHGGAFDPAQSAVIWSGPETDAIPPDVDFPVTLTTRAVGAEAPHKLCLAASATPADDPDSDDPATPLYPDSTCVPPSQPFGILSVSPCHVVYGAGTVLTIEGDGFDEELQVRVDGRRATVVEVMTPSMARVTDPDASYGKNDVTVTNTHYEATLTGALIRTPDPPAIDLRVVKDGVDLGVSYQPAWYAHHIQRAADPSFPCAATDLYWSSDGYGVVDAPATTRLWFLRVDGP